MADRKGGFRRLQDTPIGPLLPVVLAGGGPGPLRNSPFRPELTEAGREHLVMRLASGVEDNLALWAELPEMHWAAPVASLAPGAESLLAHPTRVAGAQLLPVIAVHRVGTGKVMFCGVDETWRWRRGIGDQHFYRFWAQSIRYLIRHPFAAGDERARLSVDRTTSEVGEPVGVEAFCLGPDGFPLTDATVRLVVTAPDGSSEQVTMEPARSGWGIFRAEFTPRKAGRYELRPWVSAYEDAPLESSASVEVTRPDLESTFLAQDRATLAGIAEASGGRFVDFYKADELVEPLTARSERRELTAEFSPTHHWLFYVLLAGLFSTAWVIRKRSGLA
jgi:hypothetical protein